MIMSKIKTLKEGIDHVVAAKKAQQKVVFTNGCFDILHVGHVRYLEKAKAHGDILVVGLNSDASVKVLKGNGRPVNSEYDRATVLSALEMIDIVIIFSEKTPIQLIEQLKPDIHVKGGDYSPESLPEYEVVTQYGGRVIIETFIEGYSTTSTIKRAAQ